jgi:hypothetical protein
LIDNAPTVPPVTPCLTRSLRLATSAGGDSVELLPKQCILPTHLQVPGVLPAGQAKGYLQLLAGPESEADAATPLGEAVFELTERGEGDEAMRLEVLVSEQGEISLEVTQVSTGLVVASLTIPASA